MIERDRATRQIAVIGLGRFGLAVARTLYQHGHEVLGVDCLEEVVQNARDVVTHAVQADLLDAGLVRELGLHEVDAAVVAIGGDNEASIFTTAILLEVGVPHVVARANTPLHGQILLRVGAHRVVYPETASGESLAHTLRAPDTLTYTTLGEGMGISTLRVPARWVGCALADLHLPERHPLIVLAIQRANETLAMPATSERVQEGDILAVLMEENKLDDLPSTPRRR